jgi:hypothetical protein
MRGGETLQAVVPISRKTKARHRGLARIRKWLRTCTPSCRIKVALNEGKSE